MSGSPPGGSLGAGRPYWRSVMGRKALLVVRVGSGGPTGGLGGVGRTSQRSGRGREASWSSGGVLSPSQRSGRCR